MSFLQEAEAFDPARIETIDRALKRAWEVISRCDVQESDTGARKLLALCVMHQLRRGEENFIRIVDKAVADFRRQIDFCQVRERQSIAQVR